MGVTFIVITLSAQNGFVAILAATGGIGLFGTACARLRNSFRACAVEHVSSALT
jgi:hypothetical protein